MNKRIFIKIKLTWDSRRVVSRAPPAGAATAYGSPLLLLSSPLSVLVVVVGVSDGGGRVEVKVTVLSQCDELIENPKKIKRKSKENSEQYLV